MIADKFRAALRAPDEGRSAHDVYDMEDGAAALGPVNRALCASAFRGKFLPVRGPRSDEILRAAMQ